MPLKTFDEIDQVQSAIKQKNQSTADYTVLRIWIVIELTQMYLSKRQLRNTKDRSLSLDTR